MTPDLGTKLRQAREAAGMTLMDVVFELRLQQVPGTCISTPTLHRIEVGKTTVPLVLAVTLAGIYGINLSDLSAEVVAQAETVRDLLIRYSACSSRAA